MQGITEIQLSKRTSIGKLIAQYLKNRSHKKPVNITLEGLLFNRILDATEELVDRTVKKIGISKTVTDTQKEETVSSLLEEIIVEPEKLDNKSSQTASAQIRNFIYTANENSESQIESYLKRRAITLLRKFSEGESAEYIKVLNNTRKALDRLTDKKITANPKSKYYSIKPGSTTCFDEKKHKLKIVNLLNVGEKPKISTIIIKILTNNEDFLFTANDLAKLIAPIKTGKTPHNDIIIQNIVDIDDPEQKSYREIGVENNTEEIAAGKDYFKYFIQSEMSDTLTGKSSKAKEKKLALLAMMCHTQPDFFYEANVFTENQRNMPLIDCAENFLNDKRFFNSIELRTVSRSTAHNRLKEATNSLKTALIELSAEEKKSFIKELSGYLTNEFLIMTGEKK